MIRIERDPEFWERIVSHPAIQPTLLGFGPDLVAELCVSPRALPFAARHGGYIFIRLDAAGFACELHSLFTPEGWGREAHQAGIEAAGAIWRRDFQIIQTLETTANPRSRPPRSFGFRPAGAFRPTPAGDARLWTLSRADWSASPASRRHSCP